MVDSFNNNVLGVSSILKTFPGVIALDNIFLSFEKGKVHAIIGENGAGKSTLIKIITGKYKPDEGEVLLDGQTVSFNNTYEARQKGIAAVYQESECVSYMNVAENIFLGNWNKFSKKLFVNRKLMIETTKDILNKFKLREINVYSLIDFLSASEKKWIDIIRVLCLNPKTIILDEPTAPFSTFDVKKLFNIIEILKKEGKTIIYISHRLEEIFEISDTTTVLKDGKLVKKVKTTDIDKNTAISLMVGRKINTIFPSNKTVSTQNKKILSVKNLKIKGFPSENISFDLFDGEILGIFGLKGQGQNDIVRALFGVNQIAQGYVYLNNSLVKCNSPIEAVKNKIAFLSEHRNIEGLCLNQAVKHNISLANLDNNNINSMGFISGNKEGKIVKNLITQFNIKVPSIMTKVEKLSGGNRQKVLISKWIASGARLFLFEEPTVGIDVVTKMDIYTLLRELANKGIGIIVLSSDMIETIGISDRIAVIYNGRIVKIFDKRKEEITEEQLCEVAIGLD